MIILFGVLQDSKEDRGCVGSNCTHNTTSHPHMIGHQKSQHHPTISTNSFIIKRLYQRLKNFKKQMGVSVLCVSLLCLHVALTLLPLLFVFVPIRSLSFMLSPLFIFIHTPFFSHASITLIVLAHIPISNQLP